MKVDELVNKQKDKYKKNKNPNRQAHIAACGIALQLTSPDPVRESRMPQAKLFKHDHMLCDFSQRDVKKGPFNPDKTQATNQRNDSQSKFILVKRSLWVYLWELWAPNTCTPTQDGWELTSCLPHWSLHLQTTVHLLHRTASPRPQTDGGGGGDPPPLS